VRNNYKYREDFSFIIKKDHGKCIIKVLLYEQSNEECSNQNISLVLSQMKMLQQVEVRSSAKRSTRLSSAVSVATLYDFAVALKIAIW
jgi:hypothetical protein